MLEKIIDLIKQKDLIVPNILFFNYKKLDITESELILIIYLINSNPCFNLKQMSIDLNMNSKELLMLINSLTEKDLLEIKVDKNNSYCTEEISLEKLYQKIGFLLVNQEEKKEDSTNLYSIFEQEFGRTISPMEYEIINAWKSSDFTDELIISALKEATYNGVTNLRYIDKILHEWKKKGIKTSKDVELDKQNFNKKNNKKVNLIDYDWLNENE